MTVSKNESVVLSGCGWVTPVAVGAIDAVLGAAEESGPLCLDGSIPFRSIPDAWADRFEHFSKEILRDRGAWIAAMAAHHALADASLPRDELDGDRVGFVLGCGLAGQQGMVGFATEVREQSARFVSPIHFPQTVGNFVSGAVSRGFGFRGPNSTVAGGVASGLLALFEGHGLIITGQADVVLAGGAEQLTDALARGMSGPGVVPAEGACLFAMERESHAVARGAVVLARIRGVAPTGVGVAAEDADVLSCAGTPRAGSVFIEHWIGRSLGADAAAAVAAGIAAAWGTRLPVSRASGSADVAIQSIDRPKAGGTRVTVMAGVAGEPLAALELSVPHR